MLITSACLYGASHGTTDATPKNTKREVTVENATLKPVVTNRTNFTPNECVM